jgi:hypothetical protein
MKQNLSRGLEAERRPQTDGQTWPPYTAFISLLLLFGKERLQLIFLILYSYYVHTVRIRIVKMI